MQSRACWSLAASTLACLALATRAEAADAVAAAPATSADSPPNSANPDDAAAAAFSRALQQHAAGDLEGARSSMLESYRLSNRAELLYNIGKIQSALGECSLALAAYRDYLEQVPDGRYRAEALQARTQLEAQCPSDSGSVVAVSAPAASEVSAAAATPVLGEQPRNAAGPNAPDALPKKDAPTPGANRAAMVRWIGWSAIGAGALAGVGAVYFTARAYDAHGRFKDNVDAAFQAKDGALVDYGIRDEQHAHQRWAKILGATGGVLVVGGTLTVLFGPKNPLPARARIDFQLSPGSLGASYAATF
ncbi:MAG TPA: hypothetical protein VHP33_37980 [Polyangiaceae bacterium]|nr:hypothetical protein [Polyangiaceae bacterium]